NSWRILTGILPAEVELGINFFGTQKSVNILTPNSSLCKDGENLNRLLNRTQMLVSNLDEHCDMMDSLNLAEISKIHKHGPKLVIVTDEERGGFFSLRGQTGRFHAKAFPGESYPTGAGDWFLSGLVAWYREMSITPENISLEALNDAIEFATTVAGKKVLMPGGTRGPLRSEI
ncbi:MAG: carbohydrate kinase family protein, partial [Candidatus Paceibacteria bacterium]